MWIIIYLLTGIVVTAFLLARYPEKRAYLKTSNVELAEKTIQSGTPILLSNKRAIVLVTIASAIFWPIVLGSHLISRVKRQ